MQHNGNRLKWYLQRQRAGSGITLLTGLTMLLAACGSSLDSGAPAATADAAGAPSRALVQQAAASSGSRAVSLLLQATEQFIAASLLTDAASTLQRIEAIESQAPPLRLRYAMAQAELARASGDGVAAVGWLTSNRVAAQASPTADRAAYFHQLGELYQQQDRHPEAVQTYAEIIACCAATTGSDVVDPIWHSLQQIDDEQLRSLAADAASYELRGWVELARVYRNAEFSLPGQLEAIRQWQRIWSNHSANTRLPRSLAQLQSIWRTRPRHIALLLPTRQSSGLTIQQGFFSAYYEALTSTGAVPKVTVFDTSTTADVFSIYDQAVAAGVDLIIGPLSKTLVNQLGLRDSLPVPTLALNYLDRVLPTPGNLYQFGLAPEDEITQLAELAWQAGHRNAAVLTPRSQQYVRLRDAFVDSWEQLGGQIVSTTGFADTMDYSDTVKRLMAIDSSEARAEQLLNLLPRNTIEFIPRRRQDIDCIFLVANPGQGRLIKPTLAFYFAENIPVYSMPSIYQGRANPNEDRELNGVWFTDAPWLLQAANGLKQAVAANLRPASGPLQRLRALGVDSFRLRVRLQQLATGAMPELPGATGVLSMGPDQRIRRRLKIARFEGGLAREQAARAASGG